MVSRRERAATSRLLLKTDHLVSSPRAWSAAASAQSISSNASRDRLIHSASPWAALAEGDGEEPEDLLLEVLPVEVLDHVYLALWGSPWDERSYPAA